MNIGIVGHGIVGEAVGLGLKKMDSSHNIFFNDIDPARSTYTKEQLAENCDLIFLCVPTPTKKNGAIDLSALLEAVRDFRKIAMDNYDRTRLQKFKMPPLIIKSTVLPQTTSDLNLAYNQMLRFSFNPEFITEERGWMDFVCAPRTVIGSQFQDHIALLKELYKNHSNVILTDSTTAELAKYLSNIFLVLKVAYSLQICGLSEVFGADSMMVADIIGADPRISPSHLNPTKGKIPRKSPCLPKDIRAFRTELKSRGVKSRLIDIAEEIGVEKQ